MIAAGIQIVAALLIAALVGGSLLGLSRNSHWFVRGWEYPRLQMAAMLVALLGVYGAAAWWRDAGWSPLDWCVAAAALAVVAWHLVRVFRYTPLAPTQVVADADLRAGDSADQLATKRGERVRVVTSNVEMENHDFEAFVAMVREADPDVVVALEIDQQWMEGIAELRERFEHVIAVPQDNWYGMILLTKLEVVDHEVRYIVQEDIPSIHARLRLPGGGTFVMRCLHPRPPEPVRGTHATSRDAELVVVGREVEEADEPTIVTGDLNDVAWSHTTRLFLRLSQLLDPRRGRGLYATWPVDHPFWRVPLDHIFHSEDFTYGDLQVLPSIGSDHFPICADLVWRHDAELHQEPTETFDDDQEEAQDKVDEAEEVNSRRVRSPQRTAEASACEARPQQRPERPRPASPGEASPQQIEGTATGLPQPGWS